MNLLTLNVYSLYRFGRAVMFACSTSDAPFFDYCRYQEGFLVLRIFSDKTDGSGRAVSTTGKAFDIISVDYT